MSPEERSIFFTILIAVLVLAALIAAFVIAIIRYNRKRMALHIERARIDILALEKERARFAADLHDDLGGTLSAIKLKLQRLAPPTEKESLIINALQEHIDDCMQKLREVAYSMIPRQLQRRGLKEAIPELINFMDFGVDIEINFTCEVYGLDKEKEIHLYRIIQEILSNIHKHAQASQILIELLNTEKKIVLHIFDNGRGFDKQEVAKNKSGLGLHNILSRVQILNAKLYLDTAPGTGVDYLIETPRDDKSTTHISLNRG